MKNTNSVKKLKRKQFFFLSLIDLIIIMSTYIILPVIFNYPPYAENDIAFQNDVEAFNHPEQYLFVFIILTIIFTIITNLLMTNIYKFLRKYDKKQEISQQEIKCVRKDCLNIPYLFYISEISITVIVGILLVVILGLSNTTMIKLGLMLITILPLISLLQFMFLQKNLKQIQYMTYSVSKNYEKNTGIRIKFSTNLILQIIPFLLASIIIISLVGYAKTTSEKGISAMTYYKAYFENRNFDTITIEGLKEKLDTIPLHENTDYYIIIPPNRNQIYTSNPNTQVSEFFLKYLDYYFYKTNGMIYEYYGIEQQAYMIELHDQTGNSWYIGFEFLTSDYNLMIFYVSIIFALSILYVIFIYIWSRNTSTNISTISESLEHILKENNYDSNRFLPIVSNDEFGDLAYSYNKIEELTNQHLKEIQNNQDMLIEQERLASLGQMIGGIAHNLKTPIFSISGGLEGLNDLINEFDQSIGNPNVTNEDMHNISKDMRDWIDKLKGYISYMSDVITAVKGQTVTMADNASVEFSVTELFKRVDILMKHEIKNALATLAITNNVGDSELLRGNINSLVQIINNIISNALEAYGNNYTDKKVELNATLNENNVVISIKDYGPGISEIAQKKLFKEMITTKGKNGTGLGMFISYSNIKAHFNGDLTYETEIGKGTTFYITLPISK